MDAYTVVITSCNRFDLLEKTLESLLPRLDGNLREVVIAEDSGKAEVQDVVRKFDANIRVLLNRPQLGQHGSIDRAYSTVTTPFVFHCEDDWDFFGTNFVRPSIELLNAFPKISMISLRPRSELNPLVRNQPPRNLGSITYFEADPTAHPEYFGYSFNPGMRRMSDYYRFGPFIDYQGERELSYCFKKMGYHLGYLELPATRHAGWDRHVHDPKGVRRAFGFSGRLKRSLALRMDRMRRFVFPNTDPAYQLVKGKGQFAASRFDQISDNQQPRIAKAG